VYVFSVKQIYVSCALGKAQEDGWQDRVADRLNGWPGVTVISRRAKEGGAQEWSPAGFVVLAIHTKETLERIRSLLGDGFAVREGQGGNLG
jgi:hypothetical protein